MAEKRRFLDVWIVETNTVYKEVPFAVVADWVQQGRLLEDDMVKPSGTAQWFKLGGVPELTPYLPRAEPFRADDQAEALEPVQLDFRWKKRHLEEDDDPDMIPLIDVSLVLLIFFMLTASAIGAASLISAPEARYGTIANDPEAIRIDIDLKDGEPVYAVAVGDRPPSADDKDIEDFQRLLRLVREKVDEAKGRVEVVINAHKELRSKYARDVLVALQAPEFRNKIKVNFYGVSEREQ
jgi:biopolymer transport protein ExbD